VPLAASIGALTPFCSCSTVPMANGMKAAGIPIASLIATLLASPLINRVAVALLGTTVGIEHAILYTVAGIGFAMLAGVTVEQGHGASLDAQAGPAAANPCTDSGCSLLPVRVSQLMMAIAIAGPGGGLAMI
jgi:uncharacterized membrane protein YraQ (UPF0718 family)